MGATGFDDRTEGGRAVREEAFRTSMPFGGAGGTDREGATMRVELDPSPAAASEARAALTVLDGRLAPGLLDDIRLLVSELVTNSVRHSDGDPFAKVGLEVVSRPTGVRVEVTDSGRGFEPRPRDDDVDRIGGWGLQLVDRLAERWGVDAQSGSRVWFELAAEA